MQRHQLLLTGPLLMAPVPQGLKMHTHRCILRSRLLKIVQSLYPPYSVASPVTGSSLQENPRTRIAATVQHHVESVCIVVRLFPKQRLLYTQRPTTAFE
jgi:hypothetical protein